MGTEQARTLLDRTSECRRRAIARWGENSEPCMIVDCTNIEAVAADALELHDLRRLLAGLPDDDWQPFDWAVFSVAQQNARDALGAVS